MNPSLKILDSRFKREFLELFACWDSYVSREIPRFWTRKDMEAAQLEALASIRQRHPVRAAHITFIYFPH
jgi:hypothetical protein